ncbi:MAG: hypothetical protein JSR91_00150 [Proteobacteria bacterium]|nr:hypothetical protein [Pseudomonadota bacterium]
MTPDDTHKRGVRFDPSIRLDNALTIVALIFGGVSAWISLSSRVEVQATKIAQVEANYREGDKRIETMLLDKINDQRALIQNVNLNTAASINEIKAAILRVEEKLDRKADKPGWGAH